MITSIQSFLFSIPNGYASAEAVINPVNLNYAVIIALGNTAPSIQVPESVCYLSFLNNFTLQANIFNPVTADGLYVSGMVIEFDALFVKSKQDLSATLLPTETEKETLIEKVNLSRTVLFPRGSLFNSHLYPQNWFYREGLIASTLHKVLRSGSTGALQIFSTVLEFK